LILACLIFAFLKDSREFVLPWRFDLKLRAHSDSVLIAAAFCMYSRYLDGLATWQPHGEELYRQCGKKTAREGYVSMSREYIPQLRAESKGA